MAMICDDVSTAGVWVVPCLQAAQSFVCNLKEATGNKDMAAVFGKELAHMSKATVGQVYRLDWMILKPESAGKYSLGSSTNCTLTLVDGFSVRAWLMQPR